ncbi:hypothetical protein F4777DRAFT_261988 [Nemania sp. FL0916]|nr:hypothetical protein F4777DRAFT_261988 [Nemania sp. FL0916]
MAIGRYSVCRVSVSLNRVSRLRRVSRRLTECGGQPWHFSTSDGVNCPFRSRSPAHIRIDAFRAARNGAKLDACPPRPILPGPQPEREAIVYSRDASWPRPAFRSVTRLGECHLLCMFLRITITCATCASCWDSVHTTPSAPPPSVVIFFHVVFLIRSFPFGYDVICYLGYDPSQQYMVKDTHLGIEERSFPIECLYSDQTTDKKNGIPVHIAWLTRHTSYYLESESWPDCGLSSSQPWRYVSLI